MRFEREEGFFLGAYVMNYAAASVVVGAALAAVIVAEATHHGADVGRLLAEWRAGPPGNE
jgi:hypothetical protein